MPIYEYECTKCGNIEEAVQKMSDAPLTACRQCSGKLHKLISQSSFHLKGSGWYVTDYANKSSNSPAPKKTAEIPSPTPADSSKSSDNTTT